MFTVLSHNIFDIIPPYIPQLELSTRDTSFISLVQYMERILQTCQGVLPITDQLLLQTSQRTASRRLPLQGDSSHFDARVPRVPARERADAPLYHLGAPDVWPAQLSSCSQPPLERVTPSPIHPKGVQSSTVCSSMCACSLPSQSLLVGRWRPRWRYAHAKVQLPRFQARRRPWATSL